jgi:tetratricopeptide (TPR) repeat protein
MTAAEVPPAPPQPQRRRTIFFLDLLIEILIYGLLAFLPAAYGTVDAWSERIALWIGAAIAIALAIRSFLVPARPDRPAVALVVIYLAIASFALIPLPRRMMEAISPATAQTRADLLGDLPDAGDALARMPVSVYSDATRHDLRVVVLAVVVLFAVMVVFSDPARMRRLLTVIALIGLAGAALAIAQDVTGTHRIYWRASLKNVPALGGPFVNHSHFSQFMNLSIGASLGLVLMLIATPTALHRRRDLPWLAATIVLGLVAIPLSLSRGGVFAMLAAGTVTLLITLARRTMRTLAAVIIAMVLIALLTLLWFGFDRVAERMAHLDYGRAQMVRDTGVIIRKFPVTGIGLGAFEWVYPAYNRTNVPSTASHLENEYVQSAAEVGIAGSLVVLAFAALVWWRSIVALRAGKIVAVGLGYGLLAVMIHSLSDYGQHLPSIACLSAAVSALTLNLGRRVESTAPGRRAPANLTMVILAALAVWAVRDGDRAAQAESLWKQANALNDDSSPEYGPLLDAAVAAAPDDVHLRYWSAVFHWRTSQRTPDEAAGVIASLNAARKLCPTYAPLYSVLGQIEYGTLKQPIGVTHLHTAARLDPCDPTTLFLAGRVDARRGDWDTAVPLLRRAVDLDYAVMADINDLALKELHKPELAIRVAGNSYYRMLQLANAMLPLDEYREAGEAVVGRAVDLMEQACQQPGAPPALWAQLGGFRADQKRYADSEAAYARALQSDPLNLSWRIGRANALAGMGRFNEAIEEARSIARMYPNDPAARELVERLTKRP